MTIVAHELKASYAFIERNFYLTRRYWGWELAFLVYSVAGALSISLIGADQGSSELLLTLMVGAIMWNYLSVVFSWIAETIAVERWEGTLEYTFMAPIRRWTQLFGSVAYAMVYGLIIGAQLFSFFVLGVPLRGSIVMPCAWPAISFQASQRLMVWPRFASVSIVASG